MTTVHTMTTVQASHTTTTARTMTVGAENLDISEMFSASWVSAAMTVEIVVVVQSEVRRSSWSDLVGLKRADVSVTLDANVRRV